MVLCIVTTRMTVKEVISIWDESTVHPRSKNPGYASELWDTRWPTSSNAVSISVFVVSGRAWTTLSNYSL